MLHGERRVGGGRESRESLLLSGLLLEFDHDPAAQAALTRAQQQDSLANEEHRCRLEKVLLFIGTSFWKFLYAILFRLSRFISDPS